MVAALGAHDRTEIRSGRLTDRHRLLRNPQLGAAAW
jgi:hypothetical protein